MPVASALYLVAHALFSPLQTAELEARYKLALKDLLLGADDLKCKLKDVVKIGASRYDRFLRGIMNFGVIIS